MWMEPDLPEVREKQLHPSSVKVHLDMCTQLLRLVDKVSRIFPDIEAARPRCTGLEALSLLHKAIEKANLLVQNCRESSKLYLALTGDTIVTRIERTRNLLQQSLRQLQTTVPVVLEFEISEILDNLRDTIFFLDSGEDEAGKALRSLLHEDESLTNFGDSEIEVLQFVALRLNLTSQKDLLVERRSIRKLLDDVKEDNPKKRTTLRYMLHLLKKYDKQLVKEQQRPLETQNDCSFEKFDSKSFESFDSNTSAFSRAELEDGFGSIREISDDSSRSFQFFCGIDDIKRQLLSNASGLPWESQCRAVQDVKYYLMYYNPSCAFVSSENFLEPLVQFLKDALDRPDVEAQKAGSQLLLTFLRASKRETVNVSEDVYTLLASFLETEATAESLAIMEVLSTQVSSFPDLAASSSALTSIIKLLDKPNEDFHQAAIRILYNSSLNLNIETFPCKLASDLIPKLVPFLGDSPFGSTCLGILGNLCKFEEARVSIAETDGCIASLIELLDDETRSSEEQELAVGILLSLCSQRDEYCHLVLHEGVVPSLCHLSVNGSEKAKTSASQLLKILRDIKYEDDIEDDFPKSNVHVFVQEVQENFDERNSKSLRMSGSLGRKMKMFLKKKLMLSAH